MRLEEARSELFYFGRYNQFCPPGERRIYVRTIIDPTEVPPMKLLVDREKTGFDISKEEFPFINVDRAYFEGGRRVDFRGLLEAYKNRTFHVECQYSRMVSDFASVICEMVRKNEVKPDAFVVIPTRNEVCTSRAVKVIKEDFLKSGINPFFIVLNNDIVDPRERKGVLEDLRSIRKDDLAFVIDLQFTDKETIGDVRAILADIAMEVNNRLADSSDKIIPMIVADADNTTVQQGTYKNLIDELEGNALDSTTAHIGYDPETILPNEKMAFFVELSTVIECTSKEFVYGCIPGPGAVFNIGSFPAFGNYPRLNTHEDAYILEKIKQNGGRLSVLSPGKGLVLTDGSVSVFHVMHELNRYDNFGVSFSDRSWRAPAERLDLEEGRQILRATLASLDSDTYSQQLLQMIDRDKYKLLKKRLEEVVKQVGRKYGINLDS